MTEYADNINVLDYKYKAKVYIQELAGVYKTDIIVKMELNSSNFNFSLAQDTGNDFRLAEQANGSGVFKMWKSVWSQNSEFALLWFKLPVVFADQELELTAFWGNETTNSISDPTIMDAIYIQEFNSSPLDYTEWQSNDTSPLSAGSNQYGYRLVWGNTSWYIETVELPLSGLKEWILEFGGFVENSVYSSSQRSFRLNFEGTQNPFNITYYGSNNSYGIRHNISYGDTTYQNITGCEGLECDTFAYNQLYVSYRESLDRVYIKQTDRPTLDDYSASWERKVEDETHLTRLRIYAYEYVGNKGPKFRLKWLLLRHYSEDADMSDFDLSNLYIENEHIAHQPIDHEEYGEDITNTGFEHNSNSGDAYNLSDNLHDSISDSWSVGDGIEGAWATINFGGGSNLVDESLRHYDSGHINYLNASKLSNDTNDVNDNNAWYGTTSSGYACIDFGLNNNQSIAALAVRAVPNALDNMPKDVIFQAGNSDPRLVDDDRWVTLYEGNFEYQEDEQYIFFTNDSYYRYYKLIVLSTFTGADIKLYTWRMYENVDQSGKKVVSKFKLLPLVGGDYEYNFPKNVKFTASNDGITWVEFDEFSSSEFVYELTSEAYTIGQEHASYTGGAFDGVINDGNATGSWYAYYSGGYKTSGWTGQDFGSANEKIVVKYRIYGNNTNTAPKSWTFEASDTGAWSGEEVVLEAIENYVFSTYLGWHDFIFPNTTAYRYYRINVSENNGSNTYLIIREIEMFDDPNLDYKPTYTPFYDYSGSRWQEYSFENITGYYIYKLECTGNWGSVNDDTIIAEWSMHEKITEKYTHRILAGNSDDYNSVWLLDDSTFDDVSFLAANNVLNMAHNDFLSYYESFGGDLSGRGEPTIGIGDYGDEYLDVITGKLYIKDVPIYSDDKTGAGTASASFNQSGHPPEDAFDDNNSTYFSTYDYTEDEPQWLGYDLGAGNEEIIHQITLLMSYQADLEAFTFKASNDGVVWTNLLIETAIPASDTLQLFPFTNETAYRYYRIYGDVCHQTGHGLYAFIINEMELMHLDYYDWRLVSTGSEINDVNAI